MHAEIRLAADAPTAIAGVTALAVTLVVEPHTQEEKELVAMFVSACEGWLCKGVVKNGRLLVTAVRPFEPKKGK